MIRLIAIAVMILVGITPGVVSAQSKGEWALGLGVHNVDAKSDSGTLDGSIVGAGLLAAHSSDDIKPTFTVEYFVADNIGVEFLGALPFKHDFTIDGLGGVGSTKQITPVLSVQYHFASRGGLSPFVGVGVTYTDFFHTKTAGALRGNEMALRDVWGSAVHLGLDYAMSEKRSVRVDVRRAWVDTRISINGQDVGKGTGDPWVYGLAYVLWF